MKAIQEAIVVEGRDDEAAIKRAVQAEVIITSGFGLNKAALARIQAAYDLKGLIIFTDPDFAGESIRKRLGSKFPHAKHAYLPKHAACKDGDIGVEYADPASILEALEKCRCSFGEASRHFTMEDLYAYDLTGCEQAGVRREKLGELLGIGFANAKAFLSRLNAFGVTQEEFTHALGQMEEERGQTDKAPEQIAKMAEQANQTPEQTAKPIGQTSQGQGRQEVRRIL